MMGYVPRFLCDCVGQMARDWSRSFLSGEVHNLTRPVFRPMGKEFGMLLTDKSSESIIGKIGDMPIPKPNVTFGTIH